MENKKNINEDVLLDPESGIAFKFPVYWKYKGGGDEFCSFAKIAKSSGACMFGGDFTIHMKKMVDKNADEKNAAGATVRLGASFLFPIKLIGGDGSEAGFAGFGGRLIYSRSNVDNNDILYAPVSDASGNSVGFKKSIFAAELEFKIKIFEKFAISAKYLNPLNNKDFLKNRMSLSIESVY